MKRGRRIIQTLLVSTLVLAVAGFSSAQSTIDAIRDRGVLRAGVKFDTPPFGFVDESGETVGYDIDLVRAIADYLGVELELVSVTSPTRIPLLVSDQVDLSAASMTHTRERDETIDFSITYYIGGQSLMVPADSDITSVDDLAGRTVAVQQGTTLEENIARRAPEANVIAFRDYNSAWLALRQGRADALTGSKQILQGFQRDSEEFVVLDESISTEPFGIGVRQGDSELRDAVNFALMALWESGEFQAIYENWFGVQPDFVLEMWP